MYTGVPTRTNCCFVSHQFPCAHNCAYITENDELLSRIFFPGRFNSLCQRNLRLNELKGLIKLAKGRCGAKFWANLLVLEFLQTADTKYCAVENTGDRKPLIFFFFVTCVHKTRYNSETHKDLDNETFFRFPFNFLRKEYE
jgi:hypothetical protein